MIVLKWSSGQVLPIQLSSTRYLSTPFRNVTRKFRKCRVNRRLRAPFVEGWGGADERQLDGHYRAGCLVAIRCSTEVRVPQDAAESVGVDVRPGESAHSGGIQVAYAGALFISRGNCSLGVSLSMATLLLSVVLHLWLCVRGR